MYKYDNSKISGWRTFFEALSLKLDDTKNLMEAASALGSDWINGLDSHAFCNLDTPNKHQQYLSFLVP